MGCSLSREQAGGWRSRVYRRVRPVDQQSISAYLWHRRWRTTRTAQQPSLWSTSASGPPPSGPSRSWRERSRTSRGRTALGLAGTSAARPAMTTQRWHREPQQPIVRCRCLYIERRSSKKIEATYEPRGGPSDPPAHPRARSRARAMQSCSSSDPSSTPVHV